MRCYSSMNLCLVAADLTVLYTSAPSAFGMQVQRSKDAFISERRAQGHYTDPFEESKA